MKMTKRIAAMAACAVMTVSSVVGMSASAGFSSTMLEPNGSCVLFSVGGETYGFQIRSEIETTALGYGSSTINSTTYLHEVIQRNIPTENVKVDSYLYGKSAKTGTYSLLSIGHSEDNSDYPSSIYAETSWYDMWGEYSSFHTTGRAYGRYSTKDIWQNFLNVETSDIS
ncbi:MAG: hypothetical protein NC093_07250 [Alistipes sp.]|nr:hypothetical protein [Alistipes sp.]